MRHITLAARHTYSGIAKTGAVNQGAESSRQPEKIKAIQAPCFAICSARPPAAYRPDRTLESHGQPIFHRLPRCAPGEPHPRACSSRR